MANISKKKEADDTVKRNREWKEEENQSLTLGTVVTCRIRYKYRTVSPFLTHSPHLIGREPQFSAKQNRRELPHPHACKYLSFYTFSLFRVSFSTLLLPLPSFSVCRNKSWVCVVALRFGFTTEISLGFLRKYSNLRQRMLPLPRLLEIRWGFYFCLLLAIVNAGA